MTNYIIEKKIYFKLEEKKEEKRKVRGLILVYRNLKDLLNSQTWNFNPLKDGLGVFNLETSEYESVYYDHLEDYDYLEEIYSKESFEYILVDYFLRNNYILLGNIANSTKECINTQAITHSSYRILSLDDIKIMEYDIGITIENIEYELLEDLDYELYE